MWVPMRSLGTRFNSVTYNVGAQFIAPDEGVMDLLPGCTMISPLDGVRIAVGALRVNVMRSLLTMLGIIIGVGAVIVMVAVGAGAREMIGAQIRSDRQQFDPGSPRGVNSDRSATRRGNGAHLESFRRRSYR